MQPASVDRAAARLLEEFVDQGLTDARTTLAAAPWLEPAPKDAGVRVFDVMHDILVGKKTPSTGPHTAAQPMEAPPGSTTSPSTLPPDKPKREHA